MATSTTRTRKKKEIDPSLPEGIQKRMRNLVQYSQEQKTKTAEEEAVETILEEDPVKIESVDTVVGSETVQVPVLSESSDIETIPITAKAVLKKEEYKIFITEVTEWFISHPDWRFKEDVDDIYGIAMEKVIQYRLLLKKKQHPRSDIEKDYNSSVYRMQAFRQNLAARRSDRISKKGSGITHQTNIAIIASELDSQKFLEMKKRVKDDIAEEDALFGVVQN